LELPVLDILPDLTCDTGDTLDDTDGDNNQSDNKHDDAVTLETSGDLEEDDTEATEPGCCGHETTDARDKMEKQLGGLCLGGGEGEEGMEEDEAQGKEEGEPAEDKLECRGKSYL